MNQINYKDRRNTDSGRTKEKEENLRMTKKKARNEYILVPEYISFNSDISVLSFVCLSSIMHTKHIYKPVSSKYYKEN